MLSVGTLNQFYGGSHTLWDLSLDVPKGSCTCLMGRNGMGKTTLLKCIMGLLPVASGSIEFESRDLARLPPEVRARLGIGLTARRDSVRVIPEHIFEMFPVLKRMLRRRGGDLSGGQQQQLAIGRALVIDPTLLILDEPTEGIQPNIVHEIGDVIVRLRKAGLTVLLVEHKLPFARRVASDVRILDKGRLVVSSRIEELTDALVQRHLTV
jgi:urea transport system ATP-binding protein